MDAPLCEFGKNIWIVDGPPVRFAGVPFPTRMIIVRLADGSLWVNSPVSVPEPTMAAIQLLGPTRNLVAPTKLHLWRLEEWSERFPEAELWGPPRIPKKLARKEAINRLTGDTSPPAWAADLDQLVFKGSILIDEVFFLHRESRTVILADFIQRHHPMPGSPLGNRLKKMAGVLYPDGGVPIDVKASFAFTRSEGRRSLAKLLSWDFDQLIIAHGECVRHDAKRFVRDAFDWLR